MNVYVVDDERELLASLALLMQRLGHEVTTFGNARSFLDVAGDLRPGCVLLDYKLPDLDGLQVQSRLVELDTDHAVVLLTGYGDVTRAVSAMRAGAVDFLQKPFRRSDLIDALDRANERIHSNLEARASRLRQGLLLTLTAREIEVLRELSSGKPSKVAAFDLGLSPRTIDMHRARIIKKLDVPNIGAALLAARDANII